jgi:hypothetical protein
LWVPASYPDNARRNACIACACHSSTVPRLLRKRFYSPGNLPCIDPTSLIKRDHLQIQKGPPGLGRGRKGPVPSIGKEHIANIEHIVYSLEIAISTAGGSTAFVPSESRPYRSTPHECRCRTSSR